MSSTNLPGYGEIDAAKRYLALAKNAAASAAETFNAAQARLEEAKKHVVNTRKELERANEQLKETEVYMKNVERKWAAFNADEEDGQPAKKRQKQKQSNANKKSVPAPLSSSRTSTNSNPQPQIMQQAPPPSNSSGPTKTKDKTTPSSSLGSSGMSNMTDEENEKFLMFARVLSKYLELRNAEMHATAKAIIKECYEKHKSGDPQFKCLANSMKVRLRSAVGEFYWKKAGSYLEHYLKQKGTSITSATSKVLCGRNRECADNSNHDEDGAPNDKPIGGSDDKRIFSQDTVKARNGRVMEDHPGEWN